MKVESTKVEIDGCFEVLSIAKAACSSLDGHDLVVDAFCDRVGDPMSAVGYDILDSLLQSACEFLHRFKLGMDDSVVPLLKETLGRSLRFVSPQIAKQLLVEPRSARLKGQRA